MTSETQRFRVRVGHALAAAGLSERSVAAEVLLLMPEQFLAQYEKLYQRVWPSMRGGLRIGDADAENPTATKWRTSTSQVETRGTASPKGSGSTSKGLGVGDVQALADKEWIDRKLRKLARELDVRMSQGDGEVPVRRCTGGSCRKIAENTWSWCPFCGAPTEEIDR